MPNAARLRIDPRVIKKMLRLPDGWKVHRIRIADDAYDDALSLVVEGPGLPEVTVGQQLPELIGSYRLEGDGSVSVSWESLTR